MSPFLHSAWPNPLQREYEEHFSWLLLPLQLWPSWERRWGTGLQRLTAATDAECGLGWAVGALVFHNF